MVTYEDPLANEIRRCFIACRREAAVKKGFRPNYVPGPSADGGRGSGRTYKAVWPKLAIMLRENGYYPHDFVVAQFAERPPQGPIPEPRHLLMGLAIDRYVRYREKFGEQARNLLVAQQKAYERELFAACFVWGDYPTAVRFVLSNRSSAISPLFAYLVAVREGLQDMRYLLLALAVMQYQSDRARYDRWWAVYIGDAARIELTTSQFANAPAPK